MAGNAIRHGTYVEPTLVDSVDLWEAREATDNPPRRIVTFGPDEYYDIGDYFIRRELLSGLFN